MFTKLILLLIFINLIGTVLKWLKKREREKRIREGWNQETSAGTEARQAAEPDAEESFEPESQAEPDPDDLLQQIFSKLEEPSSRPHPSRSEEPPAAAPEPSYAPVPPTAQPLHVSTEPERPVFRNETVPREFEAHGYNARGYDAREHEKKEYDNIRESKSLIDLTPGYQTSTLIGEADGRPLEPALSPVSGAPTAAAMEGASERLKSPGGLRQAVVMAEILGKPRSLNPGGF